jgi:hypothetical protein
MMAARAAIAARRRAAPAARGTTTETTAGLGRRGGDRRDGGRREKSVRELHEESPNPDLVAPDSESCVATGGSYKQGGVNLEFDRASPVSKWGDFSL